MTLWFLGALLGLTVAALLTISGHVFWAMVAGSFTLFCMINSVTSAKKATQLMDEEMM